MFVNRSGQNEQSLERTIHRCFLSSVSSFGWEVSGEKIKTWKVNGRQTTDTKWWQKLTLPLARWAKKHKRTNNDPQNTTQKTKKRAKWTTLKTGGDLRCSWTVSSSCSTCGTCRVTVVTNLGLCSGCSCVYIRGTLDGRQGTLGLCSGHSDFVFKELWVLFWIPWVCVQVTLVWVHGTLDLCSGYIVQRIRRQGTLGFCLVYYAYVVMVIWVCVECTLGLCLGYSGFALRVCRVRLQKYCNNVYCA